MKPSSISSVTHAIGLAVCFMAGWATTPAMAAPVTFFDDFNRPDGAVGNGWSNYAEAGNVGSLVIQSNVVTTSGPLTFSGIYRPLSLANPVTVSMTITDSETPFGGPFRYDYALLFGSTGSISSGYGIGVVRTDSLHNNSQVTLIENGTQIGSMASTFQFGLAITPEVTVNPDGSVSGSITGGTDVFNFSFGPRALSLLGANFVIHPANNGGAGRRPTVDDVSIVTEAPEPATWSIFGLALLALKRYRRKV